MEDCGQGKGANERTEDGALGLETAMQQQQQQQRRRWWGRVHADGAGGNGKKRDGVRSYGEGGMGWEAVCNVALLAAGFGLGWAALFIQVSSTTVAAAQWGGTALSTLPYGLLAGSHAVWAIPAQRLMRNRPPKLHYVAGAICGAIGNAIMAIGAPSRSFALLCLGAPLCGVANAYVNFLRFEAARFVSTPRALPVAISMVIAGGVVGGAVGPILSRVTRLAVPGVEFLGTYVVAVGVWVLQGLLVLCIRFRTPHTPSALPAAALGDAEVGSSGGSTSVELLVSDVKEAEGKVLAPAALVRVTAAAAAGEAAGGGGAAAAAPAGLAVPAETGATVVVKDGGDDSNSHPGKTQLQEGLEKVTIEEGDGHPAPALSPIPQRQSPHRHIADVAASPSSSSAPPSVALMTPMSTGSSAGEPRSSPTCRSPAPAAPAAATHGEAEGGGCAADGTAPAPLPAALSRESGGGALGSPATKAVLPILARSAEEGLAGASGEGDLTQQGKGQVEGLEEEEVVERRSWRYFVCNTRFVVAVFGATMAYTSMATIMLTSVVAMTAVQPVTYEVDFSGSKSQAITFADTTNVIIVHVEAMFIPSFFTGVLIRVMGADGAMVLGFAVMLLSEFLMVVSNELWNFYTCMLLLGLGWNFAFVGSTALLTTTYRPQEKELAQGMNDAVVFAVNTVVTVTASMVLRALNDWHSFVILYGALTAPAFLVAFAFWLAPRWQHLLNLWPTLQKLNCCWGSSKALLPSWSIQAREREQQQHPLGGKGSVTSRFRLIAK